jgi:hypothetical protein
MCKLLTFGTGPLRRPRINVVNMVAEELSTVGRELLISNF